MTRTKVKAKAIRMPGKEHLAAARLVIQRPLPTEPHLRNTDKDTKPSASQPIGQTAEGLDYRFLRIGVPTDRSSSVGWRSQPRVIGPGSLRKARPLRSDYNQNTHPQTLNIKQNNNDSNCALPRDATAR
jgi:hypothetical protein